MKGTLRALSIETYVLSSKGKVVKQFRITDADIRKKIDHLQGTVVDYDDIASIVVESN